MRRVTCILVFAWAILFAGAVERAEAAEPKAGLPSPSDGAKDIGLDVTLWWSPGWSRAAKHQDIFLGTDESAVRNATDVNVPPGVARVIGSVYTRKPASLELGKTYYWRVDTIWPGREGSPWKGDVWRFTTKVCVDSTDNFESYGSSDALRGKWTIGGGSWIELSTTERRGGSKSMELQYYNRYGYKFSDASRTFDPPQDWASKAASVLEVYMKGFLSNKEDQVYFTLEDADGTSATVLYGGGSDIVKTESWMPCGVFLDEFIGVDLSAVKTLVIGIGDPTGSTTSLASGIVFIDDISLCVPACIPEIDIVGDLTEDCKVDFDDHAIMARYWGRHEGTVSPRLPNPAALKGFYKFDETYGVQAKDSSGSSFHGQLLQKEGTPVPKWETGKKNKCLFLNGEYGVLIVDPDASPTEHVFSDIDTAVTICAWVKGSKDAGTQRGLLFRAQRPIPQTSNTLQVLSIYVQTSGGKVNFETGPGDRDKLELEGPDNWDDWNHYAFVKDADRGLQQIYRNGCLLAEAWDKRESFEDICSASIGLMIPGFYYGYTGWVDDFRVYNYALSGAEIVSVMGGASDVCPLESLANIHDEEEPGSRKVDVKDYSMLAENWLAEEVWPER